MLSTLKLLLPALLPSWEFFKVVAPSPRIEWRGLNGPDDPQTDWQEFKPRPAAVSIPKMLGRLMWNPGWNEALFLTSLSERLIEEPTHHSETEIYHRLAKAMPPSALPCLQFRLIVVYRDGPRITRETAFVAPPRRLADIPT